MILRSKYYTILFMLGCTAHCRSTSYMKNIMHLGLVHSLLAHKAYKAILPLSPNGSASPVTSFFENHSYAMVALSTCWNLARIPIRNAYLSSSHKTMPLLSRLELAPWMLQLVAEGYTMTLSPLNRIHPSNPTNHCIKNAVYLGYFISDLAIYRKQPCNLFLLALLTERAYHAFATNQIINHDTDTQYGWPYKLAISCIHIHFDPLGYIMSEIAPIWSEAEMVINKNILIEAIRREADRIRDEATEDPQTKQDLRAQSS